MKGTIKTIDGNLFCVCIIEGWETFYPLHPYNIAVEGMEVDFELVDEFTHPHLFSGVGWGDGSAHANIINYYL